VSPDQWGAFLPIVLIILAFWLLAIRPARKRQQEAQRVQNSLEIGARVMLTSGIFGRVAGLDDDTVDLEVAPGVSITALRPAVARVVDPATELTEGTTDMTDDAVESGDSGGSTRSDRADGRDAPA
jgi:preprotein translocase subunit YajC